MLKRSGVFVFDLDGRKSAKAKKFLLGLDTPVAETPNGFHVWCRGPRQQKRGWVNPEWETWFARLQRRFNGAGLSIDEKTIALTTFRYAMLPPSRISRHRKYPNWKGCVGSYRWLNLKSPDEFKVTNLA
jgi:hypothetical protein